MTKCAFQNGATCRLLYAVREIPDFDNAEYSTTCQYYQEEESCRAAGPDSRSGGVGAINQALMLLNTIAEEATAAKSLPRIVFKNGEVIERQGC